MDNWQRLEQVIKWAGLSTNAFALGIGLKRSENLYQIKRGSFGISKELARLISQKYTEINRAWLLTGEGSMLIPSSDDLIEAGIANLDGGIPYFQSDILQVTKKTQPNPVNYLLLPMFQGASLAASYSGNAMSPSIPSGSTVVVKTVSTNAILPGETYVVVTKDYVVMRKIRTIENSKQLLLVAENRGEYDDVTVNREEITSIFLLMGILINFQG